MSTTLDRKELKRPDAFLEKAQGIVQWGLKQKSLLVAMLLVLVVIGAGVTLYGNYSAKKEAAAAGEYFKLKQNLLSKIGAPASDDPSKPSSTAQEKDPLTGAQSEFDALKNWVNSSGSTVSAYLGAMYLGDLLYRHGHLAESRAMYETALKKSPSRHHKTTAQYTLASILEMEGKTDESIEMLNQVLSSDEKDLKVDVLFSLARLYEAKGDKTKAIAQYDVVLKDYPNSAFSKQAESRKSRLQ